MAPLKGARTASGPGHALSARPQSKSPRSHRGIRTRSAMLLFVVGAPVGMLAWAFGIAWSLTLIF
jgi:hypothetical protein